MCTFLTNNAVAAAMQHAKALTGQANTWLSQDILEWVLLPLASGQVELPQMHSVLVKQKLEA